MAKPTVASLAAELHLLRHDRLLRRKDLLARYGICQSSLDRWIRSHRLPTPIRITGPLWRLSDLEALEARRQR